MSDFLLRAAAPGAMPMVAPAEAEPQVEEVLLAADGGLDDEQLQEAFKGLLDEAEDYGERLDEAAAQATRDYMGEPLGDEVEGRSQLVLSVVRDTVRAALPSLLRALVGSKRPAEFVAYREEQADAADQATALAYWGIFTANPGWVAFHDAILDALTRRIGWLRWWWNEWGDIRTEQYDGLLEPQLQALLMQPGVNPMRVSRRPATQAEIQALQNGPEGQLLAVMPGTAPLLYRATLTRRQRLGVPRLVAVPSEEIRISPGARGVHDAAGVFHARQVRVSELVARGLDMEEVLEAAGAARPATTQTVRRARNPDAAGAEARGKSVDPSMRVVTYTEGWFRADVDGDGIAELIYGEAVGDQAKLLRWAPADHAPVAELSALREAHNAIGLSLADMTEDLQATQSRVMRAILDSMMSTIMPRTVMVEGQASVADVMNTEVGAVIRVSSQGAVQELGKPFIGPSALPIMEALDAIRESRTGITRASQGLTAEALQSTTALAVSAQVSASADRLEYMARCLAETGLRQAYIGMARMLVLRQDRPRALQLRGKWVPVNLDEWSDQLSCQVNVAGRGAIAEQLQALAAVLGQQREVVATLGPNNPIVSLPMLRNTMAQMAELALGVDGSRYFKELPADFQLPVPPPKPTVEEAAMEIEKNKAAASVQKELAELRVKREQMYLDDDRERDKIRVEALLEAAKLRGEGVPINLEALDALMARDPIPPEPIDAAPPMPDLAAMPPTPQPMPAMMPGFAP